MYWLFTIEDEDHAKYYLMKYKVGYVGCEYNKKNEVILAQSWLASSSTEDKNVLKTRIKLI